MTASIALPGPSAREPHDGRQSLQRSGFSYLARFIRPEEATALTDYVGQLHPLWERRHQKTAHARSSGQARTLTRPVYWLGAWQFASLGYYSEPAHRMHRCVRAEAFPEVIAQVAKRLLPILQRDHGEGQSQDEGPAVSFPNTCLINFYGRKVGQGVPVDYARLRMHRDGEPGPVVMFNLGQAGLLEFVDPSQSASSKLAVWTRHRSVTILSGPEYKDRLYHRVPQVRMGAEPRLQSQVKDFELRRVSISFRQVPEPLIEDFADLPTERRQTIRPYVEQLAANSEHFRRQLARD